MFVLDKYMKKITILSFLALLVFTHFAEASHPDRLWTGPVVSNITNSTAGVAIPEKALKELSTEQKAGIYFEYYETQQVCIMIYPTPEHCLPKKTSKGQTSLMLQNLKTNTLYSVSYKLDNSIACIMAPCHENSLQSAPTDFKTLGSTKTLSRNLYYRTRGAEVLLLQDVLRESGYLSIPSTGYFGIATFKAVKNFQKNYMLISPTGYVGARTREALNSLNNLETSSFEGVIQAVSTACFSDGECSVTIDGKKVVTTIGWSQQVVGSIKGSVNSIGDIETSKIGARAKVYAKKTTDGYTLYGSTEYYIEVF